MGIAVATMVVFSAVMKRVDWAVAESACESGFRDNIVWYQSAITHKKSNHDCKGSS